MDQAVQKFIKNKSYLHGEWIGALNKETFDVLNPATGELITSCANMDAQDTINAIEIANEAMKTWKKTTAKERSIVLRKWYDLIMENQETLAHLMTLEQGKTLEEARGEVGYGASFVEWFAEEAKRTYGDTLPTTSNDRRLVTIRQPVGVVAAITPWNFPNAMITRKAAPALAAGCCIVVKPAEDTPLSALALAELADQAGIPAGVFNVITTDKSQEVGFELTTHPLVRKVTFTGSTPVGKILLSQASQTVKKVSMELGGNAPIIIFADADLDKAADACITSKFRNSGQTCICANRILVEEAAHDKFMAIFAKKVSALTLGNGLEKGTDLGPLINQKAVKNVSALINDAIEHGAEIVSVGQRDRDNDSNFYPPTVLKNVPVTARVFKEEIFGPVAPIYTFKDEAEAIEMANDTEFGLAAYVFTKDNARIWRVSEAVEYGMVGVNEVAITSEVIPFGGVKQSGLGREGSKYGMDDYTEIKYICMGDL